MLKQILYATLNLSLVLGSILGETYQVPNIEQTIDTPQSDQLETAFQANNGGSDEFGYTWDDTVPVDWIDATTGTDTNFNGYSPFQSLGPITITFPFSYYENVYSHLWINAGGYLAFSEQHAQGNSPVGTFPNPNLSRNAIAPLWSYLNLAESGTTNRVYYKAGGASPNRYFAAEWYQVVYGKSDLVGATLVFTYEVVLYENGNIRFQYLNQQTGPGYCDDFLIGIQNANGYDGITYSQCTMPPSNKAVLFTPPPNTARIQVLNPYQGVLTHPNEPLNFAIELANNGTRGTDIYNLTSNSIWPIMFYDSTGIPLIDSNRDGSVDTGELVQGGQTTILAKIQTPVIVNPYNQNNITLNIASTIDASRYKTATLQSAVPVPFAYLWGNSNSYLSVQQPGSFVERSLPGKLDNSSIAEATNGYVVAWGQTGVATDPKIKVEEVNYGRSNWGEIEGYRYLRSMTTKKISDYSGVSLETHDKAPIIATTLNGATGIVWYNYVYSTTGKYMYNIYFAGLDANNDLAVGPKRLTNFNSLGDYTNGLTLTLQPAIAATSDNRFIITWAQTYYSKTASLSEVQTSDIYYTVLNSSGDTIQQTTRLTNDPIRQGFGYSDPVVKPITDNRVIVAFNNGDNNMQDTYFAVIDSNGSVIKTSTNLSNDGSTTRPVGRPDAVQLTNGNIILAWGTLIDDLNDLRFITLDSTYNVITGPISINHPSMRKFQHYSYSNRLSLVASRTGHAILTWMEADPNFSRNLYYALIANDGTVVTPPMIFASAANRIGLGLGGYNTASYSITPTVAGVDTFIRTDPFVESFDGQMVIPVYFGNNGDSIANSIVVTATLGAGLTYLNDTSGITPTVNTLLPSRLSENSARQTDIQYTWAFSNSLAFLGSGQFVINAQGLVAGSYPVTVTVSSNADDGNFNNNSYTVNAILYGQLFLPLIVH